MEQPRIVNYIEVSGKDVPIASLSDQEKKEIAEMIQNRLMQAMGYKKIQTTLSREEQKKWA